MIIRARGSRSIPAVAAACAFVVLVQAPAFAYHSERQQELQDLMADKRADIQRAQAEEQDLLAQLTQSAARQAELQARVDAANADLAAAARELGAIQRRLDAAAADLAAKNAELGETLAELDLQLEILDGRVRQMYIGRPSPMAEAIKRAESFTDIVDAHEYVNAVVADDATIIAGIEATKLEIESQRAVIEDRIAALQDDRLKAQSVTDRLAAVRAQRAADLQAIATEVARQRVLLAEIRARKAQYQKVLAAYERENDAITQFLQGSQNGQSVVQGRGGWLRWPVSGYISSGYGWRRHPVYGYRSFHTGIDIAASMGTTVQAARKGRVIYTGYNGPYGLIVLVDHGGSIATMYAHLSQTYVREGEYVNTLESIAAVGSTGWSTGPHLHFEVRVEGQHSNPMQWL